MPTPGFGLTKCEKRWKTNDPALSNPGSQPLLYLKFSPFRAAGTLSVSEPASVFPVENDSAHPAPHGRAGLPGPDSLFWRLYGNEKTALEIALEPSSAVFMLCINLGAFLVYHTVIRLINEQDENRKLAAHNHQLQIQNLQYENLSQQIAATRQARHDLRHHITIMDEYLTRREYEKLHEYLQDYQKSLPGHTILFCKHNAVNILLSYFAQQATEKQIDFSVSASIPAQISIPDSVLSALLGNLLENAVFACQALPDQPGFISVKAKVQPGALFLQVENSYHQEPIQDDKGRYLSSKRKGPGIGLESVRSIAAQYNGLVEIEPKDGCFRVSILLNLPQ